MTNGMHDFDFLMGSWKIHNRFLKKRLAGCDEWLEFPGTASVEPVLGGMGNVERYRAVRDGKTIEGTTLRLFNPSTGEWSLHWADTVRAGFLQPPMVGRFDGDAGEFYGDEFLDGKTVRCRYRFRRAGEGSPRWEQSFSGDGGKTWEINWIMTMTPENA